jgi:DNA-binding NarL/FixJ family response regulator
VSLIADLSDEQCTITEVEGSASYCTIPPAPGIVRDRMGQTDEVLMIRLLVVDDQPAVRRGLRVRFHLEPDMQVVGEASTGREALTLAQTLAPDVVLMDIEMPGMDGIEATAALRTIVPQSAVVILSIHTERQTRIRAQAAGAVAFVEKRGTTDTLLAAIRQAAGQTGESIEEREVPDAKQDI